jgi:predicted phage tail protein
MSTQSTSLIIGAGGGGKGGSGSARVAQEAPDSLRSKAYARVVDLVCEGEIEGLAANLQSVYLDDTPIQNPDGSYNFTGVTLETRLGT